MLQGGTLKLLPSHCACFRTYPPGKSDLLRMALEVIKYALPSIVAYNETTGERFLKSRVSSTCVATQHAFGN